MNWYYALNGQQLGPVSDQDLAKLAASGTINANTLVWRDGQADWQPVATACPAALGSASADAPQLGGFAVPVERKDLVVQQMREGVVTGIPGHVNYGGFWIRFVAKFIDGLILMVPQFGVQMVLGMVMGATTAPKVTPGQPPSFDPAQIMLLLAIIGSSIGLHMVYSIVLVSKYGATWGKMAVGLKIVTENGSKLTVGRAVGRFFAEWVSGLTLYIGYIIAGFDSEKRALHDHICSTRVIKTR